ncbi:MAG: hypothetical protein RI894_261 [Bacteroidota bacterium]
MFKTKQFPGIGILCLLIVSSASTFAQEKKEAPVPKSEKSKVVDFSNGGVKLEEKNTSASASFSGLTYKNAIHLDIISWISGYSAMSYERALKNDLTLELGVGLTLKPLGGSMPFVDDFVLNLFAPNTPKTSKFWNDKGYEDSPDFIWDPKSLEGGAADRFQTNGNYYMLESKYFFDTHEAFDGTFYSIRLQYMRFNYLFPALTSVDNALKPKLPYEMVSTYSEYTDIVVHAGRQRNLIGNHVIMTGEIGLGARLFKTVAPDWGYTTDPLTNIRSYESRMYERTLVIPMVSFNIKAGFVF